MPEAIQSAPREGFFGAVFKQQAVVVAVAAMLGAVLTSATPHVVKLLDGPPDGTKLPAVLQNFQQAKWQANPTCGVSENLWHPRADNAQIDATICPGTGDILVSVRHFDGRMTQYWPALADGSIQQSAVNTLFASPAAAAIPPVVLARHAVPAPGVQTAQDVTCQMQVDGTHIRRRLHRSDGTCVDIIIDTSSGAVVRQTPISCSAAC